MRKGGIRVGAFRVDVALALGERVSLTGSDSRPRCTVLLTSGGRLGDLERICRRAVGLAHCGGSSVSSWLASSMLESGVRRPVHGGAARWLSICSVSTGEAFGSVRGNVSKVLLRAVGGTHWHAFAVARCTQLEIPATEEGLSAITAR